MQGKWDDKGGRRAFVCLYFLFRFFFYLVPTFSSFFLWRESLGMLTYSTVRAQRNVMFLFLTGPPALSGHRDTVLHCGGRSDGQAQREADVLRARHGKRPAKSWRLTAILCSNCCISAVSVHLRFQGVCVNPQFYGFCIASLLSFNYPSIDWLFGWLFAHFCIWFTRFTSSFC